MLLPIGCAEVPGHQRGEMIMIATLAFSFVVFALGLPGLVMLLTLGVTYVQ